MPNETLFHIIELNVRSPDKVIGDIRSQYSTCLIGEKGVHALVRKHGLKKFLPLCEDLLDYAEELTRAELRTFPDGEYEFTDYIDDDGFGSGQITLHVKLTKRDSEFLLDFSGTSPQVKGAGADPGPVCYDTGGMEPTVTDANVLLGYFNPEYLVGGDLKLNTPRAREVLEKVIALPTGLSVEDAAYGIHAVANAKMTRLVKRVTTEWARNPADYTLVAFGGCGPAHAVPIAQELGIKKVVIPPGPGVFSSLGLLFAGLEQHRTATYWKDIDQLDYDHASSALQQMIGEAADLLRQQEVAKIEVLPFADMRYSGQNNELSVAMREPTFTPQLVDDLKKAFHQQHEQTFGYRSDEPVQIFRLRVIARSGEADQDDVTSFIAVRPREEFIPRRQHRQAYFGPEQGWMQVPVVRRSDLTRKPTTGPLIVEEYDATTVVPPGWATTLDRWGNIAIQMARRSRSSRARS